jgi:hypothetical protein
VLAVLLVYWPVASELLQHSAKYATVWGKQFANWNAIEEIFSRYLLFGARSWIAFLVTVGVPLNFTLGGVRTAQERASLCVGLSIFVMFVVCLKINTR